MNNIYFLSFLLFRFSINKLQSGSPKLGLKFKFGLGFSVETHFQTTTHPSIPSSTPDQWRSKVACQNLFTCISKWQNRYYNLSLTRRYARNNSKVLILVFYNHADQNQNWLKFYIEIFIDQQQTEHVFTQSLSSKKEIHLPKSPKNSISE